MATTKAQRPTQALQDRRSQLTLLTETGAQQTSTQGIMRPLGTFEILLATSSRKCKRLTATSQQHLFASQDSILRLGTTQKLQETLEF